MRNYHTSLLASRLGVRQVEILDQADAAAADVDRAIGRVWRQLLQIIQTNHGYHANRLRALAVIGQLGDVIPRALAGSLAGVYRNAREGTGQAAAKALPTWILRQMSPAPAELVEHLLREDLTKEDSGKGSAEISAKGGLRSREPARKKRSAEKEKEVYRGLIFPAPGEGEVLQAIAPFVRPADWQAVGGDAQKKMPAELADLVARGIATGLTQQQLAKQLLPHFDGQKARARTVARTFSMLVAHKGRMDATDQMGDMVVGYQIHATRDAKTRPEHAARDGTVYYKDPKAGQKGLDQMPRPPLEADGKLAFN